MNKAICRYPSIIIFHASLFAVAMMLLMVAGCGHRDAQATPNAEEDSAEGRAVSVRTASAERRTIEETVSGLGTCEALLDKTALIAPAIEGQVLEILIKPGDTVKAGQPIVQLDPKLAEANLQEKISTRDGLKASLRLLQSLPRTEEQKSCRLAIDEAKIALQKAETIVERLRPLDERKEISHQQMFEAELAVGQARIALQRAENQLEVLLLGPRAEAVDEAKAHINTAEDGVMLARSQHDLLTIRSPIDGVVDRIACKLGQTLAVGAPIGEVVDTQQIDVLVWLPTFDAASTHIGQKAQVFSGDSLQRQNEGAELGAVSGKVSFVGHVVDPQTGSLPIRILIDNPKSHFAMGQTVTAAIAVREKSDVLAVPVEALDDLGAGPQISVVRDSKTVVLHPHLGMRNKQWVEIQDTDLKPGEAVIVEGGYNMPEGTKVSLENASKSGDQNKTEAHEGAAGAP
jgi:multidrug efflux pump subunit AcrA (membrane-fusion protein)